MLAAALYVPAALAAALAEIAGCFSVRVWPRSGRPAPWALPGTLFLILFAWLPTLAPADHAGRAHASYGGVHIVASLLWGWIVAGARPERSDVLGAVVAIVGAGIILLGPRGVRPCGVRPCGVRP